MSEHNDMEQGHANCIKQTDWEALKAERDGLVVIVTEAKLLLKEGLELVKSLQAQLAEAQAACAVKDEALRSMISECKNEIARQKLMGEKHDSLILKTWAATQTIAENVLSPAAGQSLLDEVKGLREAVQRFLDEFGPNQCECKSPSPLMEGKTVCDYCFGRAALKKGGK